MTRIIKHPDGTVEREQTWRWRYRTQDEKIAVHACMETGEPINCPVKLPSYVGTSYDSAFEQLANAGYMIIKVDETVDNEGQNGVVVGMDPGWRGMGVPRFNGHAEGRRVHRGTDNHHYDHHHAVGYNDHTTTAPPDTGG